jgi:hypothetical protein
MHDRLYVRANTISCLTKSSEFDYYVAYPKDDSAKEPIAASYSAPGVLAEAAAKVPGVAQFTIAVRSRLHLLE